MLGIRRREFVALIGGAAGWPLAARAQPANDRVRPLLGRIMRLQAEVVANEIGQFIKDIEAQVGSTTQLPWSTGTPDQRRFDGLLLLRRVPAITELTQLDSSGKEQLRVSRLAMDVIRNETDYSQDPKFTEAVAKKVYYGPVYFRRSAPPRSAPCEVTDDGVERDGLSGVGIYLTLMDGQIKVMALMDNMPAAKAGIMAGDLIVALDDELLRGLTLTQVVERIRGPANTSIKVTLVRTGHDKPIEFSITRDVIKYPSVSRCPPVSHAEPSQPEPYMTLSLAGTGRDAGVSVAEVNLKLIQDLVSKMEVGEHGVAYVVDSQNRVIAHRNSGLVNADFSSLTEVQAARAGSGAASAGFIHDIDGRELLVASIAIPKLGWLMFAELPNEEADVLAR